MTHFYQTGLFAVPVRHLKRLEGNSCGLEPVPLLSSDLANDLTMERCTRTKLGMIHHRLNGNTWKIKYWYFLPARTRRVQAGTESHNYVSIFLSFFLCMCVRCYLLILLQSFQCRGGIISDLCSLCRSQSLGTSH